MNEKTATQQELIYGYPSDIHELAVIYINRDILKCETTLIEALLAEGESVSYNSTSVLAQFTYENIENYYNISPKWLSDFTAEQQALFTKYNFRTMEDFSDFMDADEGVDSDGNSVELDMADYPALEDIHHEWKYRDSEAQEIFEWWSVTSWLAEKLLELGEPVLVNDYGQWWGRTCTGQNIILDGTFQNLAISLKVK